VTITTEDPLSGSRSTMSSTVSRTAAATAARQRQAATRTAFRLVGEQLDSLPDEYLTALTSSLVVELRRRGLPVPWLDD
jgi:hypothetical protein